MPIPISAIIAGASVLSSLLKSQQYYPAAQAPTQTQLIGDAIGGGLAGFLGGSILDPLTGAPAAPTASADPSGGGLVPGGALGGDDRAVIDFLTNGGITGRGSGVGGGGTDLATILDLIGSRGTVPSSSLQPSSILGGL